MINNLIEKTYYFSSITLTKSPKAFIPQFGLMSSYSSLFYLSRDSFLSEWMNHSKILRYAHFPKLKIFTFLGTYAILLPRLHANRHSYTAAGRYKLLIAPHF